MLPGAVQAFQTHLVYYCYGTALVRELGKLCYGAKHQLSHRVFVGRDTCADVARFGGAAFDEDFADAQDLFRESSFCVFERIQEETWIGYERGTLQERFDQIRITC